MKRLVSLMLTIVLLLTMVTPAMARTPEEIFQIRKYLLDQIKSLRATGKMSNDEVYSIQVDLSNISNKTVSATVYKTVYEEATVTTYTDIKPQPIEGVNGAYDKVTRFWAYLDNNDDENFCALYNTPFDTVLGYVYGSTKDQTLAAFVAGLPECLERNRLYDSGGGGSSGSNDSSNSTSKSSGTSDSANNAEIAENDPDAWAEKYLTTVFAINQTSYTIATVSATEFSANEGEVIAPTIKTMDVAPYIKEDRTYVPVRYLAYSLGVEENDVTWDGEARKVGITKGDAEITLIIGSPVMQVNKSPVRMDVSPEITNDRTFLPARWVAEALGAEVEWDDTTKQVIIKMPIEPED